MLSHWKKGTDRCAANKTLTLQKDKTNTEPCTSFPELVPGKAEPKKMCADQSDALEKCSSSTDSAFDLNVTNRKRPRQPLNKEQSVEQNSEDGKNCQLERAKKIPSDDIGLASEMPFPDMPVFDPIDAKESALYVEKINSWMTYIRLCDLLLLALSKRGLYF